MIGQILNADIASRLKVPKSICDMQFWFLGFVFTPYCIAFILDITLNTIRRRSALKSRFSTFASNSSDGSLFSIRQYHIRKELFTSTNSIAFLSFAAWRSLAANDERVDIPLYIKDGIFYANYSINGNHFRGIIDTGSPFLIVPSVCTKQWGCFNNTIDLHNSSYSHTVEVYGGQDYDVDWKVGDLTMGNLRKKGVVFAYVGSDILLPPGGVFIGLVKYKDIDIRPTLLGQLKYSAIQLNTITKTLTLSTRSLLPTKSSRFVLPLVDLRSLGDPVYHYAVKVKRLDLNGKPIVSNNCTIYAIFDSGSTGCVLSDDLMNDRNSPNPVRSVKVTVEDEKGEDLSFETKATRNEIFIVTAAKIEWFKSIFSNVRDDDVESPSGLDNTIQVVILGAIFMKNRILTIDIDEGRLQLL